MKRFLLLISFFFCITLHADDTIGYTVSFSGIENENVLGLLNEASELIELQDHPPITQAALRRRAEEDIPNLITALHSQAYYNAKINFSVDFNKSPYEVVVMIDPGPVYPIADFKVLPEELGIEPYQLGVILNRPGIPKEILQAKENLIFLLIGRGYPLAKIESMEALADQKTKQLYVTIKVNTGPKATFGPTLIEGNRSVRESFIRNKIEWRDGELYNPEKIESTINALESSRLFSSISVVPGNEVSPDNQLPLTIQVAEGKPRTIGLGIGYSTQRGPGVTGEWEHRNLRGKGERLRAVANILQDTQEGIVSYVIPDFRKNGQDLVWIAELEHDDTEGYEMTSLSFSNLLERQINKKTRYSYGVMYEHIRTNGEHKDGSKKEDTDNLLKLPFQIKWTNVDDLLDPTSGAIVFFKTVPSAQLINDPFFYCVSSLTASIYKPMSKERKLILAAKINLGTILGASRNSIPQPDRFSAGSENTLRGYNYRTVSPLSKDKDPIGGRSMIIGTLEGRWRINDQWGAALFYDVGNVFSSPIPQLDKKMLQSVGTGVRYYTPVGPLRLDVAYPINRRKGVDDAFQFYFSVGQSF